MTSARSELDAQAGPDSSRDAVSLSGLNMAVTELLYPVGRSPSPSLELANLEEAKRLIENAHAGLLAAAQARSQQEDLPMLESVPATTVTLLAHEELCAVVMMELHGVYDDPCWLDISDISQRLQRALGYVEQVLNAHRSNATTTEK